MRSVKSEVLGVALVGVLPVLIFASLPYSAVSFRASAPKTSRPFAAFITLTDEQEADAIAAARSAWQIDKSLSRRQHRRLPLGELPQEEQGFRISLSTGRPADEPANESYRPVPWLPTSAADRPVKFAPTPSAKREPVFSREEMLQLK